MKFSGAELGVDPKKFRFMRMHNEIEHYLENSGVAWTHLRPSQFMQVYLREAPAIAAKVDSIGDAWKNVEPMGPTRDEIVAIANA